uniref:Uncharacterized protein n=1 Tax=Arundo donax TaxID=35708 RepID=A0A0A8Z4A1_ARUDO
MPTETSGPLHFWKIRYQQHNFMDLLTLEHCPLPCHTELHLNRSSCLSLSLSISMDDTVSFTTYKSSGWTADAQSIPISM